MTGGLPSLARQPYGATQALKPFPQRGRYGRIQELGERIRHVARLSGTTEEWASISTAKRTKQGSSGEDDNLS
jgi:hypothetical protein